MNMNDAIIEVLSHVAAHVWNKYTMQHEYYRERGQTFDYSIGEVVKYAMEKRDRWGNLTHSSVKDATWLYLDRTRAKQRIAFQIGDDWKMEFAMCDVFDILNKYCKLGGKKLNMRFTSEHNTPSGITVDLDAIHNTCKWRLNGTLLTELDMGTINHADLAPLKSNKVSCQGKTYTMPYARPLPRRAPLPHGWWMFIFENSCSLPTTEVCEERKAS